MSKCNRCKEDLSRYCYISEIDGSQLCEICFEKEKTKNLFERIVGLEAKLKQVEEENENLKTNNIEIFEWSKNTEEELQKAKDNYYMEKANFLIEESNKIGETTRKELVEEIKKYIFERREFLRLKHSEYSSGCNDAYYDIEEFLDSLLDKGE